MGTAKKGGCFFAVAPELIKIKTEKLKNKNTSRLCKVLKLSTLDDNVF